MTSVNNRYYDPTTDQFLSIDPDVADTDQPYVFTNDDPLNAEDADGLRPGRIPEPERYPEGDLQDVISRYLGPDVSVAEGSKPTKIIFYDANDPNKEVVYNSQKNVYRIADRSNGRLEYYDSANDTWGTNGELGDDGLANSHYNNTGNRYSSVDDAKNQYGGDDGAGEGSAGDDGGGDIAGSWFFLLFPNENYLVPSTIRGTQA